MLTMSTRNEEPRNSDGVRSTTSPRGVLAFPGPPPEPIHPIHSASCPMSYVMLKIVASTADQTPTVRVDGEMSLTMAPHSAVASLHPVLRIAHVSRAARHRFTSRAVSHGVEEKTRKSCNRRETGTPAPIVQTHEPCRPRPSYLTRR